MVDTLPLMAKGGGSDAYLKGNEVVLDLSAQVIGTPYQMLTSHIGKTIILFSTVDGTAVKLLAANNAVMAIGKGHGFCVAPFSKPIKILNAGTAGTDPILEAFALPGAVFTLWLTSATSPNVTVGTWRHKGKGLFHGPVPVVLPFVQDTGFDTGDVMKIASQAWPNTHHLTPNISFTNLPGTSTYIFVWVNNAGTSVKAVAMTVDHTTALWTRGSAVTVATSANQWLYPRVIGLSSTQYAVVVWEAVNAKTTARGGTVAAQTITQGTAIISGAWGINPSSADSSLYATLVKDSASTFFFAGRYDGTSIGILHFSISGANLTQDGGSAFASSGPGTVTDMGGVSPSANILEITWNSVNAGDLITRYTYAAGSVTETFKLKCRRGSQRGCIKWADQTSRTYWIADSGALIRAVRNAGNTEITEQQFMTAPSISDLGAATTIDAFKAIQFIAEDEAIIGHHSASFTHSLTLFNPLLAMRTRTPGTTVPTYSSTFPSAHCGFDSYIEYARGLVINTTTRRAAMIGSNNSQTLAVERGIYAALYDLPRNYDNFTV